MIRTTIARWTVEHDPDATRACYAQISEELQCAPCLPCENYLTLRKRDLPDAFWILLTTLGVSFTKPAEICLPCPGAEQLVQYSVWYHFIGQIVSGDDCWTPLSESGWTFAGEDVFPNVNVGCSSRLAIVNDAFAGNSLVQLEFLVEVPWLLDIFSHPFHEPWFEALNPKS